MGQRIPLSRPFFDQQEAEAVRRVLASGWVVQGPEVEAFEAGIAQLHQARHCIAVSSGTAALHICYLALGIGPGDAVFIPSFAWPSAANMAKLVGARPVFVDVSPDTCNLAPEDLLRRIGDCRRHGWGKPRAIVPVHEFGLAADMEEVLSIAAKYSLEVIEDAACALGATYHAKPVGTFGKLGIFSFHPRKSITTGEGGAIVTNDAALAERCRLWRNHGQQSTRGRRDFVLPGLNYRMTEIQAAIGRVQLGKCEGILQKRRLLARQYLGLLQGCSGLRLPANHAEHTWQTFMPVLPESAQRTSVIDQLAAQGIEAGPGSVAGHLAQHLQPQPALPVSENLHYQGLALPLHAGMAESQVPQVTAAICSVLQRTLSTEAPAAETSPPASRTR
ncbi:MAG TPA: DegT/DnrJ/EryC1/StrS family aminotransferase [Candidatus Binatia bacterium]|jgi:perosamine synthetase|nr:DegT/DnrJ/EryC1/StrS family aminotransferase [Candidatus Binatia bacterium]